LAPGRATYPSWLSDGPVEEGAVTLFYRQTDDHHKASETFFVEAGRS
jgi:hypothetical protein